MNIGKALKEIREEKNLSLRQLEHKTNLKAQYISTIEMGKSKNPSFENLVTICTALGISLIDLLIRAGYTPPSEIPDIELAIRRTLDLTPDQKKIMLDLCKEFKKVPQDITTYEFTAKD